jgi:uncharacterized membrane protein
LLAGGFEEIKTNKGRNLTMPQLIVVGFKQNMYRASDVLSELSAMDDKWALDLRDAVAVYRDHQGKLRVDQSYRMTTGEGAGWGAFWGALIGALIALPFTGGASGAVLAGTVAAAAVGGGTLGAAGGAVEASWWKDEFGIPEEFARNVGAMVQSGDSAVLALMRTVDPVQVAERFRGYGGTILQTTLSDEQSAKVQAILDGRDRRFFARAS